MSNEAIFGLVCSVPQAAAAMIVIYDRIKPKGRRPKIQRTPSVILACLLVIGTVATACTFVWLHDHPNVVEKTVYVDRHIPCPPAEQKTDHASTRGNGSPVVTGNGNRFDGGQK